MDTPVIGQLYTCRQMSDMHGGNPNLILPERKGKITNIHMLPDWNPDGPEIIEYGPPQTERFRGRDRVEMLGDQAGEFVPVYKFREFTEWENMGRYQVTEVTSSAKATAERSEVTGRTVEYVIRLKREDV